MTNHTAEACRKAYLCLTDLPVSRPIPHWRPISALSWSLAYVLYIAGSQKHARYRGVPFPALALNLAWEFAFSFVWTKAQSVAQLVIHRAWLGLDVLLAVQFIRFEWKKVRRHLVWYLLLAVTLGTFLFVFIVELNDYTGTYMAFGQNLVMSILFVEQALETGTERNSDPWTTWVAGALRLVGTAAPSAAIFQMYYDPDAEKSQPLLPFLFVGCFVWDALYVFVTFKRWMACNATKTAKVN